MRRVLLVGSICCSLVVSIMFSIRQAYAASVPTPTPTPHAVLPLKPIRVINTSQGPVNIYDTQSVLKLPHSTTTANSKSTNNANTSTQGGKIQPGVANQKTQGGHTITVENGLTIVIIDDEPFCVYLTGITSTTPDAGQVDISGAMEVNGADIGDISATNYDGGYIAEESGCAQPPQPVTVTSQVLGGAVWLDGASLSLEVDNQTRVRAKE